LRACPQGAFSGAHAIGRPNAGLSKCFNWPRQNLSRGRTFQLAEHKPFNWPNQNLSTSRTKRPRGAAGSCFVAGVELYDRETAASFGDALFAVPFRAL
jgi:hypothetical protein